MSRRKLSWIGFGTGAFAVVLLLAAFLPRSLGSGSSSAPVFRVERQPFVRQVPAQGTLRAVRATQVAVPMGAPGPFRIAWLAPDGAEVKAGDVVARFDATELVKELTDAEDDRESAGFKIGKQQVESQAEVSKLDRTAGLAREELENAQKFQKKDELVFSRNEIVESDIDQTLAREKEEHARKSRRTRQSLGTTEMELLAIERRRAEIKINRAEQALHALEVKAPYDGVLVLKRDWRGNTVRVGDSVWNGQPLAEIPDLAQMEAEVFVLEADAGGLAPGKRASVVLESRPDVVYPAEIQRVDALAKPRLRGSPVQYFAVTLKLARTEPAVMKPGQRVRATLVLEERKEAQAVPRQAVFEREGKMVVYRQKGDSFEPVEVSLGSSGAGKVVVEKGIAPGDLLALTDPTRPRDEKGAGEDEKEKSSEPSAPAAPGGGL